MTKTAFRILIATSALTAAMPAFAQEAPGTAGAEGGVEDDIVVTARRDSERLQDVPVSVQVVSGDSLQKLAVTSADEVSKLTPGLTLTNAGVNSLVVLRGVAWRPASGTPATPIYYNEVPFNPSSTIRSLYDIGQIEVLRGPQGTSRGAPSISGAVTISTRKPDLSEFGGYVQGQYGEANHWDVQAAVNVPIVKDVLAIRLATNIENSEGNQIYSVHSAIDPFVRDRSFRATALFRPTDTISIQAMYQRRTTDSLSYAQVAGPGSPGAPANANRGAIPANFNGPALTVDQRASVQDVGNRNHDGEDLLTLNASWEVFGHKLTYNFGKSFGRSRPGVGTQDPINILPGFEPFQTTTTNYSAFTTNEVRISSLASPSRPFDYDIGWYSQRGDTELNINNPVYLSGAFGPPSALPGMVVTPNSSYILNTSSDLSRVQIFDSFYGNIRFHIDEKTELSGGFAIVRDREPLTFQVNTAAALSVAGTFAGLLNNVPAPFRPFITSCSALTSSQAVIVDSTYPGVCDAVVPAGSGNQTLTTNKKYSAALYNFSLSHKFSDDIMVYATTGSSFRTGLPSIGNTGLPTNVLVPLPETAKSYEVGVKTTWGRRFQVNAAVYQIDYKNQLTIFQGINYFNTVSGTTSNTSYSFYSNVDARIRGFEIEVAARPTDRLSLSANLSYSQIKSQGGSVPCNDPSRAITATNPINYCPSVKGQVLNQTSPFQATLNGSYTVPVGALEGYLRFNLNYQGNNPNYGNFATLAGSKSTPGYAILDLFAGISGKEGVWDLGIFAKNVFNKQLELSRAVTLNNVYSPFSAAPSGYDQVSISLPREVGVTLRYSFGSR